MPDVVTAQILDRKFKRRGNRTVGDGDSLIFGLAQSDFTNGVQLGFNSFFNVASVLSGGRIRLTGNLGVSGQTTTQIVARLATTIAAAPDWVHLCMGRNDIDGSVALTTTQANFRVYAASMRNAGIGLVIYEVPPSSTTPLATSILNAWLRRFCAANGIHLVGLHTALIDPTTGNYRTGESTDGKHPVGPGARVGGQRVVDDVVDLYPATVPYFTDAVDTYSSSLVLNPCFTAGTSAAPTSWNTSGAGGTYSRVPDANVVGYYRRMAKSSAAGMNTFQTISSGFSVGDVIAFGFRIRTTGIEYDATNLTATLTCTGSAGPNVYGLKAGWAADLADGSAFYTEFTVPASTTALSLSFALASPGTTAVLDIGQVTVVNLTTGAILTT